MRPSRTLCTTLLLSGLLISTVAKAQSTVEEMAPLPTTEQLESLLQLSAGANPEAPRPHARRRLPRPELHVNPEEASDRLAVQKLSVDNHRFVQCDLPNGKVRTGVITNTPQHTAALFAST